MRKRVRKYAKLITKHGVKLPGVSAEDMLADLTLAQRLAPVLAAIAALERTVQDILLQANGERWSATTAGYTALVRAMGADPELETTRAEAGMRVLRSAHSRHRYRNKNSGTCREEDYSKRRRNERVRRDSIAGDAPLEFANVHVQLDDTGAAQSAITRALELAPEAPAYRLEAARMLIQLGCFDEAREQLHRALQMQPCWAPVHEALGSLALWSACDEQAEHCGRQTLECDPSFAPAARLLGACALMRGDVDKARRRFDQALELDPGEAQTHVFLAELALGAGHVERAHDALSRALLGARSSLYAAQLLRLLANVHDHEGHSLLPARTAHLIQGVSELCPELAQRLRDGAADVWKQALTAALERMRGNRSATPTYLAGGRLTRLRPGLDPRFDSRRALETIQVCTPAETLAALEVVHTRGWRSRTGKPPARTRFALFSYCSCSRARRDQGSMSAGEHGLQTDRTAAR